jgi:leader peptidase (prepilin peptidase)/N-methyltransferase
MSPDQQLVLLVFAGIFGLLVGSFLNVCIFRLPRECMSIVRPRSRCVHCRAFIAWYDNIPVASWILLGGKCRRCRAPISPRYAAVELLTGIAFAWAAYVQLYHPMLPSEPWQRGAWFAIQAYLTSALIVCTFIDLEFTILPDEITKSGIVLGLVAGAAAPVIYFFTGPEWGGWNLVEPPGLHLIAREETRSAVKGFATAALGAIAGGGSIWLVGLLGKLLFRKEAMGLGDVKLLAFLGAFLGPRSVLAGFFVAVLLGALFGIGKFVVHRRMGYVPFGPFLSAGALAMVFAGRQIWSLFDLYIKWVGGLVGPPA